MKFKLSANAEVDLLTKDEVGSIVQDAIRASMGGVLYRSIPAQFTPANGALMIFKFATPPGRMWRVCSLSVSPKTATDVVQIYKNDQSAPGNYVCSIADDGQKGNYQSFTAGALIVQAGETVIVQALTVVTAGNATIRVKEVPAGHDVKL